MELWNLVGNKKERQSMRELIDDPNYDGFLEDGFFDKDENYVVPFFMPEGCEEMGIDRISVLSSGKLSIVWIGCSEYYERLECPKCGDTKFAYFSHRDDRGPKYRDC